MKIKTIVLLANGNYVKSWQYSQGYFDVVETEDVLEATSVSKNNYETFFQKDGAKLMLVKYDVTLLEAN